MTPSQLRAAVTLLASYAASPTRYHVRCIKRTAKYLHVHAKDTIVFIRDKLFDPLNINLACFSDADWAADRTSRRSMTGYVLYMCHNLISSGCKYHPTQCLSTMEAEYMGETYTTKVINYVTNLVHELPGYSFAMPVPLFGDNNAALKFAEAHCVNDRVKHIDLRHHYLQRMVDTNIISMNYVCTLDNIADILTKPLPAADYEKFTAYLVGDIQEKLRDLLAKLTHLNELRHRQL